MIFFLIGDNVVANSVLPPPNNISQFDHKSPTILNLSAMLKDKKFKSFYNEMKQHSLTFQPLTEDTIKAELKEKIWCCYLIASAPFFSFKSYKKIQPDIYINETDDISLKFEYCLLMEKYLRIIKSTDKIEKPFKKQIITNLLLPYYTHILKQFKNAYEHNPYRIIEKKEQNNSKNKDIVYITSDQQIKELVSLINEIADGDSFINSRNQIIKNDIEDLENFFMEILVFVFPNKYTQVEKFLLQAGYFKEEIPNLIDRTVGRDNKTDFLYKGKHRFQNDRLLQKKK